MQQQVQEIVSMNNDDTIGNVDARPHWLPADGWMGLIPGKSSIEDAKRKLGPSNSSEMANGWAYDFHKGTIRITVIENQPFISKIWVSRDLDDPRYMPSNLDEARAIFGTLAATARGAMSEVIFEAPGVRLAILDSESVLWMELFSP